MHLVFCASFIILALLSCTSCVYSKAWCFPPSKVLGIHHNDQHVFGCWYHCVLLRGKKNKPNSYKFPVVGINISTKIVLMQEILWFKCKIHARLTGNVAFFDELVQITRSSRSLNRFQYDLNFHLLNWAPWFPFVRC